jgi:hypothetical protein
LERLTCFLGLCVLLLGAPPSWADSLHDWRYTATLTLDTTVTGADVAGDVAHYPLAVALIADRFDFSQAQPDGADIRFSRSEGGALLPHSIELWDRAAGRALVWVKFDLVKGNDRTQSLVMHWGNPKALDASHSEAVFDVKEGFVGVWHLDDEGSVQDGGYCDATGTAAHATGVNLTPGARVDGRLGKALRLEHARGQWVKLDNAKRRSFDLTTRATFSVWARANAYRNRGLGGKLPGYETMMAKGDNSWRLQKFGVRDWHKPPRELVEICVEQPPRGDLCVVGKTDMVTDTWFHFVGVHDFPRVRLYVNGVLEKEETFDVNWISGDHPVGLGNQSQFPEQGRSWDGELDEARVMQVVKDAHWVKLEYESQREGSKLLRFGPTRAGASQGVR